MSIELDPSQHRAVDLICTAHVGVVTGGPGTGKTTCLRFALDALDARGVRYELAAPTGKAARRMHETTSREARTIHRLLHYTRDGSFEHDRHNPLDTDVVIVDESSMVDVLLFDRLTDAIGVGARLILIGDADQLPPVGPGRPFGDIVDGQLVPIARLQQLHRSAAQSWIHVNAPKILRGQPLDLATRPDFRYIEVASSYDVLPAAREIYLDPHSVDLGLQMLAPQRTRAAGIVAANKLLQDALNPAAPNKPRVTLGDRELRLGDRVIHTRNNYQLGVFNGEIGTIQDISDERTIVQLEGREAVEYRPEQLIELDLAYALTVHRAQGSEFPWVMVVCHSTHARMLSRKLLYTAITRGKQGVILIGNAEGIDYALKDLQPVKRNTTLAERVTGELAA